MKRSWIRSCCGISSCFLRCGSLVSIKQYSVKSTKRVLNCIFFCHLGDPCGWREAVAVQYTVGADPAADTAAPL